MTTIIGADPTGQPTTIDVEKAARLLVDALMLGHNEAAEFHGVSLHTIRRLHGFRGTVDALDRAVVSELTATPQPLNTRARIRAWCHRPDGATSVTIMEDGTEVTLKAFRP